MAVCWNTNVDFLWGHSEAHPKRSGRVCVQSPGVADFLRSRIQRRIWASQGDKAGEHVVVVAHDMHKVEIPEIRMKL